MSNYHVEPAAKPQAITAAAITSLRREEVQGISRRQLLRSSIGGAMALVIRAELFMPGMQLVDPGFFNTMTTVHALIMVFGAVMPATVGLANWMIPLQIGAPDMALPRMNNFSFWLLIPAALLLVSSFFMPGGVVSGTRKLRARVVQVVPKPPATAGSASTEAAPEKVAV